MCHPEENTRRAPGRAWSSTARAVPVEYPWTPRGTSTTSTPSQSSTAFLITSGSFVAPRTTVMRLLNSSSFPTLCSRHTPTTSWPRSSACWTMYFPSFPDAPTMQTLMTRLGEVDLVRLTLSRRTTPGGRAGTRTTGRRAAASRRGCRENPRWALRSGRRWEPAPTSAAPAAAFLSGGGGDLVAVELEDGCCSYVKEKRLRGT